MWLLLPVPSLFLSSSSILCFFPRCPAFCFFPHFSAFSVSFLIFQYSLFPRQAFCFLLLRCPAFSVSFLIVQHSVSFLVVQQSLFFFLVVQYMHPYRTGHIQLFCKRICVLVIFLTLLILEKKSLGMVISFIIYFFNQMLCSLDIKNCYAFWFLCLHIWSILEIILSWKHHAFNLLVQNILTHSLPNSSLIKAWLDLVLIFFPRSVPVLSSSAFSSPIGI